MKMDVCVGNEILEEEFSLRNRNNMHYPVLLGRRTLNELGPIDTSRTFTTKPGCSTGQA